MLPGGDTTEIGEKVKTILEWRDKTLEIDMKSECRELIWVVDKSSAWA